MLIHRLTPVLLSFIFCATAAAQSYPVKPIRIIIPSGAGGAYDVVVRGIQGMLGQELGQPLIIENRPGAGGIIGLEAVSRAKSDGYTLLQGGISPIVLNPLFVDRVPYDPVTSFTHIAMLGELVMALYVHKSTGATDFKGLVAYAKANPGKVAYGSSGVGQSFHLAGEMLKLRTGMDIVHAPYKGTALALQDFYAGRLLMQFYPPNGAILGRVKQGTIIPVAAMSDKRLPQLPNVPTFGELGVGDLGVSGWGGFSGPANLPKEVVTRINQVVNKVTSTPESLQVMAKMTMAPLHTTSEEMTARIVREIAFWKDIVAKLGLRK